MMEKRELTYVQYCRAKSIIYGSKGQFESAKYDVSGFTLSEEGGKFYISRQKPQVGFSNFRQGELFTLDTK